jgi:hypothetical protein
MGNTESELKLLQFLFAVVPKTISDVRCAYYSGVFQLWCVSEDW